MQRTGELLFSIHDLAQQTGTSLSALNYYVNLGLLPVAERRGNKRLFQLSPILERLAKIQELRREGYPLLIIRRQLEKTA